MSRLVTFGIFIASATGILTLLHYYFWLRLIRATALPPGPARRAATLALIALGLSLPLVFALSRVLRPGSPLLWPPYVWMGLSLYLLLTLLIGDLLRPIVEALLRFAADPALPADPARRVLVRRLLGGAAVLASGGLGIAAMRSAGRQVALKDVRVPLARLPRALDGTRIVQLTDLHIGPLLGRDWLADIVERVNALSPDLVAITGDLVDGSVESLRELVAPLAALRARHGVYFVTGNHEYYSGADEWIAELGRLGVRVLRNERISVGAGADSFDLAGIDDHDGGRMLRHHGPDLDRALAGRDPSRELILLAHQPRAIHEAVRHGVGLQLSGHTHGGQIWPWGYLVRLQQPYVVGLVREGDTHLYVSRGTGYWGPPMRMAAPAEITHIVLESRRDAKGA